MLKGRAALLFLIGICLLNPLWAQTDSTDLDDEPVEYVKPGPEPDTKVGIKMGIQINSLFGSENNNNRPSFGVLGGGYIRQKLNDKNWLQTELQISFRGSNFKANIAEYNSIRLLYIDVPILYMHAFGKATNRFIFGVQGSYLVTPSMYLLNQPLPITTNFKFNRYDVLPVVGYQYHMPFFAIQFVAKYGLININQPQEWPQKALPVNTGGSMHNFVTEINLIF
jgi:hypothetical protein